MLRAEHYKMRKNDRNFLLSYIYAICLKYFFVIKFVPHLFLKFHMTILSQFQGRTYDIMFFAKKRLVFNI